MQFSLLVDLQLFSRSDLPIVLINQNDFFHEARQSNQWHYCTALTLARQWKLVKAVGRIALKVKVRFSRMNLFASLSSGRSPFHLVQTNHDVAEMGRRKVSDAVCHCLALQIVRMPCPLTILKLAELIQHIPVLQADQSRGLERWPSFSGGTVTSGAMLGIQLPTLGDITLDDGNKAWTGQVADVDGKCLDFLLIADQVDGAAHQEFRAVFRILPSESRTELAQLRGEVPRLQAVKNRTPLHFPGAMTNCASVKYRFKRALFCGGSNFLGTDPTPRESEAANQQ